MHNAIVIRARSNLSLLSLSLVVSNGECREDEKQGESGRRSLLSAVDVMGDGCSLEIGHELGW